MPYSWMIWRHFPQLRFPTFDSSFCQVDVKLARTPCEPEDLSLRPRTHVVSTQHGETPLKS